MRGRKPPARPDRKVKAGSDFHLTRADKKLQASREAGPKPNQDVGVVGYVHNQELLQNPRVFFENNLPKIVKNHQDCVTGATLCVALAERLQKDAAETFKITTAHLGDSRAALVLKVKKDDTIIYKQALLTKDHTALFCREHIENQGGMIAPRSDFSYTVNDSIPIGGVIGDHRSGLVFKDGKFRDVYLRTPTISEFYLADFCEAGEELLNADLVVSSDGLWEKQEENFLAKAKAAFDGLDKEFDLAAQNFTQFLVKRARNHGSKDNIFAATTALFQEGIGLVQYDYPVISAASDGHRNGVIDLVQADKYDGDIRDGSVVAASVIADLILAAGIRENEEVKIIEADCAHNSLLSKLLLERAGQPLERIVRSEKQIYDDSFNLVISRVYQYTLGVEISDDFLQKIMEMVSADDEFLEARAETFNQYLDEIGDFFSVASSIVQSLGKKYEVADGKEVNQPWYKVEISVKETDDIKNLIYGVWCEVLEKVNKVRPDAVAIPKLEVAQSPVGTKRRLADEVNSSDSERFSSPSPTQLSPSSSLSSLFFSSSIAGEEVSPSASPKPFKIVKRSMAASSAAALP